MAFGVGEAIMAGLFATGALGSLFGGGGSNQGPTGGQTKEAAELQNALQRNLINQQYLTNMTPGEAGQTHSEMQALLNMLGNMMPGMQQGASGQMDAYSQALQAMMNQGMQPTDASNVQLMNLLQGLVTQGTPGSAEYGNQKAMRDRLMQNAMASQLSPEQIQQQQNLLNQAQWYGANPQAAWGMGPQVSALTNPGMIDRVGAGTVSGGDPWNIQQITPTSPQGLSDVFGGQLNRQAAAQLASQGINSPALAAEASAQAAAPYQQQMGQFAAQQDLQAQLANQQAMQQMMSQLSGQGLQAGLANQGTGLQAALANQGASAQDIQRLLGIQEGNIQNAFTSEGMGQNLYNTMLGLPGMLGPGTGAQQAMGQMASQLYGSPMFDLGQLANLTQMTPANPYEKLFRDAGSIQAPGPQNIEQMLGQLYGMMGNRAQTSGTPSGGGGGGGAAPNLMGFLPLLMMLTGSGGNMFGGGGGWSDGGWGSGGTGWAGISPGEMSAPGSASSLWGMAMSPGERSAPGSTSSVYPDMGGWGISPGEMSGIVSNLG